MLCEECGIREAQVTVTTVVNGEKNQLRLCRECVKKYQPGGDMSSLLAAILSSMAKAHAASDKVCSHCGMSLAEFRKGGVLGCAGCYEDFREELKPVLTKIQGRSQHAGRRPRGSEEQEARLSRIRELRADMEKAVLEERYEDAAELRDRIRALREEDVSAGGTVKEDGAND